MTLLELVQRVVAELGVAAEPNEAVGSSQPDIQQITALANSVGRKLQRMHPWQQLIREHRFEVGFVTSSGTTTSGSPVVTLASTAGLSTNYGAIGSGIPRDTYVLAVDSPTQVTLSEDATESGTADISFGQVRFALPSDFYRLMDRTQWDRTNHWELQGPSTGPQWQWLKSGYISTGPRIRWRQLGGQFQIWPQQTGQNQLGFEYLSEHWARSAAGASKASMTADDDTTVYDDLLMSTGTKLEYFAIKGFDTTRLQVEFASYLNDAKAADGGSPTLHMAPRIPEALLAWDNIPDSGYGQ